MPIPWLVVLQSVPWTDVIRNAPKIAEGAKKLWSSVSKKTPEQDMASGSAGEAPLSDAESLALLQSRLAATEEAVADLHKQMLASAELINTLAEQNALLVKRIEENRIRVLWLAGITAALAIMSVLALLSLR